ncbi:hypothetical protein RHCRD62_70181 [Rhodococcus sp. RD6.2]|nr:hypothetical protein RHCRD62_70181 [Rhodococcus sp. RD6.2]
MRPPSTPTLRAGRPSCRRRSSRPPLLSGRHRAPVSVARLHTSNPPPRFNRGGGFVFVEVAALGHSIERMSRRNGRMFSKPARYRFMTTNLPGEM